MGPIPCDQSAVTFRNRWTSSTLLLRIQFASQNACFRLLMFLTLLCVVIEWRGILNFHTMPKKKNRVTLDLKVSTILFIKNIYVWNLNRHRTLWIKITDKVYRWLQLWYRHNILVGILRSMVTDIKKGQGGEIYPPYPNRKYATVGRRYSNFYMILWRFFKYFVNNIVIIFYIILENM